MIYVFVVCFGFWSDGYDKFFELGRKHGVMSVITYIIM